MLLPLVIWATAVLVAASFAIKRWWFPAPINAHAASFDSIFSVNLLIMGVIFFVAQALLGWLIWKHRDRGQQARHSEGSTRLEILWTSITLLLFVGAGLASTGLWYEVHLSALADAGLKIEVAAKQFAWSFRYPGPDGKFGKTDIKLVNDAAGNPFGIVENDPAGKDDIVSSALRVPAGRHVQLLLQSRDVIHNFFVRELRIKQDLVPGMTIPFRIRADKPGEYEIACSELCGLGHHQMRSVLVVVSQQDYDTWLRRQAAQR
ncbi:MAG: cytochrome c oxidase subunit II [Bryobacterales bacterium]|nr:cytochrome c oxidase subunit II [Bryobacterales bacterium]